MRRPLIADRKRGKIVGFGLIAVGFLLVHDAYDGHGERKPWWSGPFLPW